LPTDERFAELMDQARRGSQEAAEQVWREYGPYVVYVVRRWLRPEMRGRLDSQDFAQDVWASFFREVPAGDAITTPDDLVRFLAKMAKNKVVHEYRRQTSDRRDVDREERHGLLVDDDELIDEREPTPSQIFAADALVEELVSGQPESCARMLQMRCDGLSDVEIAEAEHISTRSVRRIFKKLQAIFDRRWGERRE
jgi:RNA polymerase sigma factor (sigma-70 family)